MRKILRELGCSVHAEAIPFRSAEDGREYAVWKVTDGERMMVLKRAKAGEQAVYDAFFRDEVASVPRLLRRATVDGEEYLLMEYVPGEDLCNCRREPLTKVLDALIALQNRFWNRDEPEGFPMSFSHSLDTCIHRGKFLRDEDLEQAYDRFLELYKTVPRTLCHADLLPFNVLAGEEKATLIDWEVAGILPYPVSLARLIAHGLEEQGAFFYMTEADREYAIDYYYSHLIEDKGISYTQYRRTLDYFLLYEYCEWIMLGNRYPEADMIRYEQYLRKAKQHLQKLT